MSMFLSRTILLALFVIVAAEPSWSKEVHFVAAESQENQPIWRTDTVLLERAFDKEEDLIFILTNPTSVEHTFAMPGVQFVTREHVLWPESGSDLAEPIRLVYAQSMTVAVKPGERRRVRVDGISLLADKAAGQAARYYCEIHKDIHLAGSLYIM
ncbi:MAG: hypothetical protein NW703_04290 [Nitrospiraceae bacterium]